MEEGREVVTQVGRHVGRQEVRQSSWQAGVYVDRQISI